MIHDHMDTCYTSHNFALKTTTAIKDSLVLSELETLNGKELGPGWGAINGNKTAGLCSCLLVQGRQLQGRGRTVPSNTLLPDILHCLSVVLPSQSQERFISS